MQQLQRISQTHHFSWQTTTHNSLSPTIPTTRRRHWQHSKKLHIFSTFYLKIKLDINRISLVIFAIAIAIVIIENTLHSFSRTLILSIDIPTLMKIIQKFRSSFAFVRLSRILVHIMSFNVLHSHTYILLEPTIRQVYLISFYVRIFPAPTRSFVLWYRNICSYTNAAAFAHSTYLLKTS